MSFPRMSLHIGDYKKDTGHLRAAGHGAYLLLIMHYWATGALPDDDRQLAAIACMDDKQWKQWRPIIAPLFQPQWKHKRIEFELGEAVRISEAGRKAGVASGKMRRQRSANDRSTIVQRLTNDRSTADERSLNDPPTIKERLSNLLQPTTKKEEGGGGEDARARPPLISDEARKIAIEIAEICGIVDQLAWPPGWCGAPMTVQTWLNEGCRREIIVPACRESMMKKRDGPPDKITYFTKTVARAHAQFAAPMPTVTLAAPEKIHAENRGPHAGNRSGSVVSAALEMRARLAGGADSDPLLRLPKR